VHIPPKRFEDATMPQHLRTILGFFGGDRARIVSKYCSDNAGMA
jgi:hypothetical protein